MKASNDVADALIDLLDRTRKGEIVGFACVTLEPEDLVGQCVAGSVKDDKYKAIAAVEILKRDLMDGIERLKDHYPKAFNQTVGGKAA